MSNQFGGSTLNQRTIAGHPVGLFVLFLPRCGNDLATMACVPLVLFLPHPSSTKVGLGSVKMR